MTHGCEPVDCPACEEPQLARNTLFDGKPMSAQDFLDEQNYFLGKHLRHNRFLHGWGTACGLAVREHPNPACRNQYVLVEPGMAIDCCGHEIWVRAPAMIDWRAAFLEAWRKANGPESEPDDQPHRLSLILRYAECPADPVPAVFQGCGSPEAACLPGKLIDGYRFEAALDRPVKDGEAGLKTLHWESTNNIDGSHSVAVDNANERIYVLTAGAPAILVALDADTGAVVAAATFVGRSAVGLALAGDGSRLFVALTPGGGGDAEIAVLDTADVAAAPIRVLALAGGGEKAQMRTLSDGRLAVATLGDQKLRIWGSDVGGGPNPAAPAEIALGRDPVAIAQGSLEGYFYVAASDAAKVVAVRLSDLATVELDVGDDGSARPAALAVAERDGRDLLAVADGANGSLHLIAATPEAANAVDRTEAVAPPVTGLADAPRALAFSPGNNWLFLLSEAADGSRNISIVSVARRILGREPSVSNPIAAPPGASALAVAGAKRILVAFAGDDPADDPRVPGGLASFGIAGDDCLDLLDTILDPCPTCDEGDDLVLATVAAYRWNDPFVEAVIDNRAERRLLASTQLITEMLTCVAEQGCGGNGGEGEQGPVGPAGPAGADGKDGEDGQDGQDGQDGTNGEDGAPGKDGADGKDGAPGKDGVDGKDGIDGKDGKNGEPGKNGVDGKDGKDGAGLRDDLPRIVGINWPHDGKLLDDTPALNEISRDGLVIVFDQRFPVLRRTLHEHSVQLLRKGPQESDQTGLATYCYCNCEVEIAGLQILARCKESFTVPPEDSTTVGVTAVRLRPLGRDGKRMSLRPGTYRVVLEGDHILGQKKIGIEDPEKPGSTIQVNPALDANHFAPGLPARCPTGDRVEGGRFLSWFTIEARG